MEQTKATLNAIRECLAKNMPPHGKAMLFGSQARGTARADSDWDILVILDKDSLVPSDYDNVTFPLTMLGWELPVHLPKACKFRKNIIWKKTLHSNSTKRL